MLPYNTKKYLERQYKDEKICSYKGAVGKIDWGKNGDTKNILLEAIEKSQKKGNFTFEEMLLYAKQALEESDTISKSIQQRFPMVFIDEAQDTDSFQWELLHSAFDQDAGFNIWGAGKTGTGIL